MEKNEKRTQILIEIHQYEIKNKTKKDINLKKHISYIVNELKKEMD